MAGRLVRKFRALKSAAQAGLIVGGCKWGCKTDDENETVIPCLFHREEIARLGEINAENQ